MVRDWQPFQEIPEQYREQVEAAYGSLPDPMIPLDDGDEDEEMEESEIEDQPRDPNDPGNGMN